MDAAVVTPPGEPVPEGGTVAKKASKKPKCEDSNLGSQQTSGDHPVFSPATLATRLASVVQPWGDLRRISLVELRCIQVLRLDTKFTQQELPACKPLLTPKWVIFSFFIVGVVFIPIGAAALVASRGVVEIVQRYDDECLPMLLNNTAKEAYVQDVTTNKACSLTINVTKDMDAPVYVYYELDNFYQNHRRYVKSRSDTQLRGDHPSQSSIDSSCKPEAFLRGNTSFEINPCGLIAWSYFNDVVTNPVKRRQLSAVAQSLRALQVAVQEAVALFVFTFFTS